MGSRAEIKTAALAEAVLAADSRAIARAISLVENQAPETVDLIRELFPHTGNAYMIGVTGAPGTGKSSLTNRLAGEYRQRGQKVGVIAVDPSSPFTGGALLGDRIRMQDQFLDDDIYIRSMATRGTLGGLARASGEAALVLDAAGKDVILIETVGVGQDEVDIVRLADVTLLLLVAGLGDDVQSFKAGVMEIADIFVINKADRGDTARLEQELQALLGIAPRPGEWQPPIAKTSAKDGTGICELMDETQRFRETCERSGEAGQRSARRWESRLLGLIRQRALEQVMAADVASEKLSELAGAVARRERDPYSAVDELLRAAGFR